jgi:hypothetical protein
MTSSRDVTTGRARSPSVAGAAFIVMSKARPPAAVSERLLVALQHLDRISRHFTRDATL